MEVQHQCPLLLPPWRQSRSPLTQRTLARRPTLALSNSGKSHSSTPRLRKASSIRDALAISTASCNFCFISDTSAPLCIA